MTTRTLSVWLHEKTTILGIAGLIGATADGVAQVLTHQMSVPALAALVAGSVIAMALPESPSAEHAGSTLAEDLLTAITAKQRVATAAPGLVADALALLQAITGPTAVVVAAPMPAAVAVTPATVTVSAAPAAP